MKTNWLVRYFIKTNILLIKKDCMAFKTSKYCISFVKKYGFTDTVYFEVAQQAADPCFDLSICLINVDKNFGRPFLRH